MAEPPSMSPPGASFTERDVLLATKLHVPQPRGGFLPRPRLLDRLAEGMSRSLVLVCTPAGFGKTTLLGDWARRSTRPVAWLSLDASDNDPARFWWYLAAALDTVGAAAGGLTERLRGPRPVSLELVVPALINQLADLPDEVALVLDDYQVIDSAAVHHSLALLLDRLPPELRVVLASRADPPLPLARLRARNQLAELRAADLRFTPDEAATFLREATGLDLTAASLAALDARTEGWVAGLQLAALSLRGHTDPAGFVATFSGSHRYILDYLTEEVLARQPQQVTSFLRETSVLERLSGPLCDAVTGRADGQVMLEEIERANLFLVPLDDVRGWWRYHHLFADLLRARLEQAFPQRLRELHRNAAAWLERHGLVDDAIQHALTAGEAAWAARLVEQHAQARFMGSEGATVDRWLKALPPELIPARPQLGVLSAMRALLGGRVDEVGPLLADAERAYAGQPQEPPASGPANVPAMLALLRAELARQHGDLDRTIAFAEQALAGLPEDDHLVRSLVDWTRAVADWLGGRLAQAEPALARIVAAQWAAGEHDLALSVCYELSLIQRALGRLGAARRTCQEALERAAQSGRPLPAVGAAHVGLAEVLRQRNELDAALDHATQGVALCRQLAYAQPLAAGLTTMAWIRHAQGDPAGALQAIVQAERVRPDLGVVALLNPVPAQRGRLLLADGQVTEAAHWVKQCGVATDDQPSYPQEGEYLVLARVLLAEHTPDLALGLLGRLRDLALSQERAGSLIEVQMLRALALAAVGDQAAALAALAEAFVLAAPEGYLRVFLDEGAPIATLLGKLAATAAKGQATAARVPRPYLTRLLEAFDQDGLNVLPRPRHGSVLVAGLVAPLSARELEVLALLTAGMSNHAVAEELVITLDTVKRHVTHILDKLGAANRTQAVTRAHELGLLR